MKTIIIISTGRCGTKRLTEILSKSLQNEDAFIKHQYTFSRMANVIGNCMFYFGERNWIKSLIYSPLTKKSNQIRIFTDPLSAMCIPKSLSQNENTVILHVSRDCSSFATSMYNLTRKRSMSFFAHNFIPLWQPGLWPLENMLNSSIKKTYTRVCELKNAWFMEQYGQQRNYHKVDMNILFSSGFLEKFISDNLNTKVIIKENDLAIRSN